MYKKLILITFFGAAVIIAKAQDTLKTTSDAPLVISGSVDTYWKYDFSGHGNIPTSFASDQNSVSIGMIDLGLKKTVGKASFVGELSFGPRGQYQSIPNGDGSGANGNNSFHIQNLYVSYNVTDKFNLSAGYMSTFVGYEVISPTGNFNYSTSYLFTAGPFQNAGFKATYTFSDKVSLMAGIFNNYWNTYSSYRNLPGTEGGISSGDVSTFGAQLTVTPAKGWTAYLNVATGSYSGTLFDLTTAYQITDAFKLGLNAATKSGNTTSPAAANYEGVALYPQLTVSKAVTFGLRGEYFKFKDVGSSPGGDVKAMTVTANIKAGPLMFIPEVRFDSKSSAFPATFVDSNGASTNSASQFLLAAVYAF
jgi:Putative beta-barrel porin-2, OmpL-like. bbp2